jgi:hypothetical protein
MIEVAVFFFGGGLLFLQQSYALCSTKMLRASIFSQTHLVTLLAEKQITLTESDRLCVNQLKKKTLSSATS